MLPTYQTKYISDNYPFVKMPSVGDVYIQDIKLAIKMRASKVLLTKASCIQGQIHYTVAARVGGQLVHLGTLTYTDSLWLNINNDLAFGFIKLKSVPQVQFRVTGQFQLHKDTYTNVVDNKGMRSLPVNGKSYSLGQSLNISVQGNLQMYTNTSTIRILRSTDHSYDYSEQRTLPGLGITSINGFRVSSLNIVSEDQQISISSVGSGSGGMSYLTINSQQSRLTCVDPQQSDSLSQSGAQ